MNPNPNITLDALHHPVKNKLQATNELILQQINSDIPLVQTLCQHAIKGGGKRLRPLIALLCSQALDYQGEQDYYLATIIEFIHTATLLHDDVVDKSELRRGQQATNIIWGNEASVLAGDFLLSRALEMMVTLDNRTILSILARTTNQITQGEIRQLMQRHNLNYSEANYFEMIRCKTALLFAAASECAALLAQKPHLRNPFKTYGMELGIAFQLVDDALDYEGEQSLLGKNPGDDLAEGKPTLPILYALKKCSTSQQQLIKDAINKGDILELAAIKKIIHTTGALEYTYAQAAEHGQRAKEALSDLPDSPAKNTLLDLVTFALQRKY